MLLLLEVILFILLGIIVFYYHSFQYWKKKGVVFVPPNIPWGNYTNIFQKKHFGEAITEMYLAKKREGCKFFGIYLFTSHCFVPVDPQYIRLILVKDYQYFANRNFYFNEKDDPLSAHLLSLNGVKWKRLRKSISPTFTTGKIKMLFSIFLKSALTMQNRLDQCFQEGKPFNAKEVFSSFSTDVIINCAFGGEIETFSREKFDRHRKRAVHFNRMRTIVMYLGAVFPKFCRMLGFRQVEKSVSNFFMGIIQDTVKYREETKTVRKDFLQLLIDLKKENEEFTIKELAAQCFIFLLAGFETSAITMSFALYEITSNEHVYDKLMKEMDEVLGRYNGQITYEGIQEMTYLDQIVDETLRKHSPAYTVSRMCIKDYPLPETNIVLEKGTQILIPIRGLHMDPYLFPDPLKFDPERFNSDNKKHIIPYSYLPFGEGPRKCIGRRFGLVEVKTSLLLALQKYKYKVNKKTIIPFQCNSKLLLYDTKDGIWFDCCKK